MNTKNGIDLDGIYERLLRQRMAPVSRRSFLHAGSWLLLRTAGLVLAARVLPYSTMRAQSTCMGGQSGTPPLCGQHGITCPSGVNCGSQGVYWKQCCKNSPSGSNACATYTQCLYTDWCTDPNGPNANTIFSQCQQGGFTGGGNSQEPAWCGGAGQYVCTTAACNGSYSTLTACTNA